MDAGDGLLAAILEEPDKDDLRLILADYLDEQGQEARAEFIRVQVKLADYAAPEHEAGWECAYCDSLRRETEALRHRERELFLRHACSWAAELVPGSCYSGWEFHEPGNGQLLVFLGAEDARFGVSFCRGFIEVVFTECQQWLDHGPELVRCQPLRRVRLSDRGPHQLGSHWLWMRDHEVIDYWSRNRLPQVLWCVIQPDPHRVTCGPYPSSEAADAALSAACLLWANEQARQSTPTPTTC